MGDGKKTLDFKSKRILAPMVRVGTLPMRLLALDYGADIVYTEEIIDFKIINAKKIENELLGTVDFVLSDETVVFRTCAKEKNKVVFQLGTADAKRSLLAAQKVENYVAAIDVNMGCPKEFSIKGGMGSALLKKPEKVSEILTTLVSNLSIPVTCKIRVLNDLQDTLNLVKVIENTGVSAVAVHARTQYERPRHPNRNHFIKEIANTVNIPVIANGGSKEFHTMKDIDAFCQDCGVTSVMIARAAQWNCSIFRKDGPLQLPDVVRDYIKYAVLYDSHYANTKYCVLQMLHEDMDMKEGQETLGAMSLDEICNIWGLEVFYKDVIKTRRKKSHNLTTTKEIDDEPCIKKQKLEDGKTLVQMVIRYIKKNYPVAITPKMKLFEWITKNKMKPPHYHTVERPKDRCFHSTLTVGDTKYTTPYWEKSKQLAEQNAAVACLLVLGVHDGRKEGTDEEAKVLAKKWQQILSDEEALTKDLEVNPLPTNSTDDDKLQVNGEIRQEIDSFSTKLDTSKSTKNLTESEHENKEKVIQKTFASEDSCTRQTAVNR